MYLCILYDYLQSIQLLAFTTEMEYVYCAVGAKSLNKIQVNVDRERGFDTTSVITPLES